MTGGLSTPTVCPRQNLCSSKFGVTSKLCVVDLSASRPCSNTFHVGCVTEPLRLEGVHRIHGPPTLPRSLHAVGIPTRGTSGPVSRLQDTHVQLQCPCLRVYNVTHRCRLALLRHLPPDRSHRQLRPPYDRRYVLGLVCVILHVLCHHYRRRANAYVWKLHL